MLDEIKEFKQLTEPNDKNNPWRLRDKNLKKNLSGLSRELEILARGFLFGVDDCKGCMDDNNQDVSIDISIDKAIFFIKSWLGHADEIKNYVWNDDEKSDKKESDKINLFKETNRSVISNSYVKKGETTLTISDEHISVAILYSYEKDAKPVYVVVAETNIGLLPSVIRLKIPNEWVCNDNLGSDNFKVIENFFASIDYHDYRSNEELIKKIDKKLPDYLSVKKTKARDKAVESVSENKKWYFVYQAEEKTFNMVLESSIKDVYAKELLNLKESNGAYTYVQYKKSLKKYDKIYKKLKKEGEIQNTESELKENYDAYFGNKQPQKPFEEYLNGKNLYDFFKMKLDEKDWKEFLELCQKIDKMPYCKTLEIKPNINEIDTEFTCVVQVGRETTEEELEEIKQKLKEKFETPCDKCFEAVKKDGKNINKCQDRREVIHCLFDEENEENNPCKKYVNACTCKYFDDLGKETFGYNTCINSLAKAKSKFSISMFNDSLKDNSFTVDNSIKYQKIISNALRNGSLKERYLYSPKTKKKDLFNNVQKAKNGEDKNEEISEKDKNKILMLVAYYLIKCQENNYKKNKPFVVLNKSDFSNWIGANFESSNVTAGQTYLDRFTYSASDSVSKLFEYKNLASKITKFKINETWLSECGFELKEKIENGDTGTYYKDTGRKLEIIKQGDINGNINE